MNAAGTFLPPTREMRAVIDACPVPQCAVAQPPGFTAPITPASPTAANGIVYGQYHAPIADYLFPEAIPGNPIVENNFNTLDFLAKGGYTSAPGTLVGVLNPWPSSTTPTTCTAPVATAGGPYTVAFNGTVSLAGSATGTAPLTFAWTAGSGTLTNPNTLNPIYSAAGVAGGTVVPLTLTVTNACGTSVAAATVTVSAPAQPTVNPVAPVSVSSGAAGSFTVTGTDPNGLSLTFAVAQAPAGTLINLVGGAVTCTGGTPQSCSQTFTFTAPTLALGVVTPTVVTLTITATNGATVSTPVTTTVTVNPLADLVTITTAEYRRGNVRLAINATSSVISPNVVLKLQPYVCAVPNVPGAPPCPGGSFDPATLGNTFTNQGGGLYLITLVGAPAPACGNPAGFATPCPTVSLTVTSNLNGTGTSPLTRIRQ